MPTLMLSIIQTFFEVEFIVQNPMTSLKASETMLLTTPNLFVLIINIQKLLLSVVEQIRMN